MNGDEILQVYRNGDDNKRLSLFLGYRELREDFSRIDDETLHDDFVILRFPWTGKHWHKKHLVPREA